MKVATLSALLSIILLAVSCAAPTQLSTPTVPSIPPPSAPTSTSAPPSVPPTPDKTPALEKSPAPQSSPTPAPSKEPASVTPAKEPTPIPPAKESTYIGPRGTVDPAIEITVYQPEKVWPGTTLLADNHNITRPRIIEVNMLGEIIWQYLVPENLRRYTNPGFDVELLANSNILFVLPGNGVYEIERSGKVVWSYLTKKISHDADRLPNGNTIFAFGGGDQKSDAQVREVNPKGEIVWQWYAKDHFNKPPYDSIYEEDSWTHTNAVSRLPNGNTLISMRNFHFVVEVDPKGSVVKIYGEGVFRQPHDPEVLPNGNILLANHSRPNRAIEFDPKTGKIVWQSPVFEQDASPVRDSNRLPNGNTLITGSTKIVEVTAEGKIVWQLTLKGITLVGLDKAGLGFYKANRISAQR